ncbi:MAG TPA: hypothetical protein VEA41_10625 [Salinarimonas sp.]|jgi:hypothetical protein|nr:hypothetical protein [Salinarimonas sp.]
MANATKKGGMGHGTTVGHDHVGIVDDGLPEMEDLGSQLMGNNQMHGDDQGRVHNERHRQAMETNEAPETDEFVERHRTGVVSPANGLNEAQIEKLIRKS